MRIRDGALDGDTFNAALLSPRMREFYEAMPQLAKLAFRTFPPGLYRMRRGNPYTVTEAGVR